LSGFVWVKATSDPLVLIVAAGLIAVLLIGEWLFLAKRNNSADSEQFHSH
jgi:hypothetical protein